MSASSFYVAIVIMAALCTLAVLSYVMDTLRQRRVLRKAALQVTADALQATAQEASETTAREIMARNGVGGGGPLPAVPRETVLLMQDDGTTREVPAEMISGTTTTKA